MAGGSGWGPSQGMVRWNGLLIPQREGDPSSLPLPNSTPTLMAGGRADARKQLTLGRLPALAWSDQSPVTGAQCLPFPSLRLSWKPRLAGSESGGSLGPCPPLPLHHPAKPGTPRPGPSQTGHAAGQGGAERALLLGLDLLPGKMKTWLRGWGGARWNLFGLCSGWGFLEVRCGAQGSTQRSCHKFRSPAWWGPVGPGVSWKPLADSSHGRWVPLCLVSQVHGKQVSQ